MADRNPLNRLPAEAKARLRKKSQAEWVVPMLATLTNERFSREGWLFEPKWDGERCLIFRRHRQLTLFSRNRVAEPEVPGDHGGFPASGRRFLRRGR